MESTPEELVAALEQHNWRAVFDLDPMEAWRRLGELAEQLQDEDPIASEGLRIVQTVSGMMLDGDSWDMPYKPLAQFEDWRSALPSDLDEGQLRFLHELAPTLPGSQLAARVSDVLHLRTTSRTERIEHAARAVELWIASGFTRVLARSEGEDWIRAAEIAARYRMAESAGRLTEQALAVLRSDDDIAALRAAGVMRRARYFGEHDDEVALQMESRGLRSAVARRQRTFLEEALRWVRGGDAAERHARLHELIGDTWWDEAVSRAEDSHLVARDFFANAYNTYRAIPRKFRSAAVTERLSRLPAIVREHGEQALGEFTSFVSDPIDVSSIRELAESFAAEEMPIDALASWFVNYELDAFETAKSDAEMLIREHPLTHIFGSSTVAADGRKLHSSSSSRTHMGVENGVWSQMVKHFHQRIDLLAQSYIRPGLWSLSAAFRLSLGDFKLMVSASPFVPPEVENLYARGLHHGYYGRFAEAVHLLAPVTEACVRAALHRDGIETRNLRVDDTEIEPGLSALMELDGADEALGYDLAWNMRALYCGPLGPNLRNRVAHGLVSDVEAAGADVVFAWWLALRLAFVPYFNMVRAEEHRSEHDSGVGPKLCGKARANGRGTCQRRVGARGCPFHG
ncbi:DUF4209 domain-containing protein [Agromyces mediolanus]|uniref:DUF4209 domain-containing protein n=1 Tax=Agromyces mediolanus TaxID=41986 RepID=A0A918F6R4_AGRME|nr:DUF4209 domain-containing protein [Agromyces mediolanus]GGR13489.1 DUF4209 domain-containing protein [Agromyces mediolanus]GLJ72656.1 DUF4209 domain-containing protein [Agromyces mediolanus]